MAHNQASGEAGPAPFFTPGTIVALLVIACCVALLSWRPSSGPPAVPEAESTALLELQSKLLTGWAEVDRPRVIQEAPKLEGLATSPAGARALAAFYLYLEDDELRQRALRLLAEAPDQSAGQNLLLRVADGETTWTEAEREILSTELGWFGDLILARSDPVARERVGRTGERLLLIVSLGSGAMLVGFGLGCILLVSALAMRNRWRLRMEPVRIGRGIYLQAFAVYLVAMIGGGLVAGWAKGSILANTLVILFALVAGLSYPLLRGIPWSVMRLELGCHRGEGFWREAGAGVVTYLASLPIIALGLGLSAGLQSLTAGEEARSVISHPIVGLVKGADWPIMVTLGILAVLQGPVVEEIMFRGALYGSLRSRFGKAVALLAMAFCFAAVHPQGLLAIPALMGVALAFGFMREWRGSLVPGIVAHGLHNGVLLVFMSLALAG